jgi:hypothetical protein
MTRTVYVEASIPSFYHDVRTELDVVVRRAWTREWWNLAQGRYELVTSPAVMDELERGDYPSRKECLELIAHLPLLAVEPPVMDIVDTYIARHVMPADPAGDALHLALASFHQCDFLVTWNCQHLANARSLVTFVE